MHINDQKKLLKLIIKETIVKEGIKEGILDAMKDKYDTWKGNRAAAASGGITTSQRFFNQKFGRGAKFPMSMPQASFRDSTLTDIGLGQRDLTNASFENANLIRVDFQSANLTNANFNGATLNDCRWDGANVNGAKFENVKIMTSNANPENLTPEELLANWIKTFKSEVENGSRVRFDDAQMPTGGAERAGFLGRKSDKEKKERLQKDKENADRIINTKDRVRIVDFIHDLAKNKVGNYREILDYVSTQTKGSYDQDMRTAARGNDISNKYRND